MTEKKKLLFHFPSKVLMVEKYTSEYICKVGDSKDLLIGSGGLCSKYQTKTMKSQDLENSSATHIFKYTSHPSGLGGVTLTHLKLSWM